MTTDQIQDIALGMLSARMTDWRGIVCRLNPSDRLSVARALAGACEKAARAMAYVEVVEQSKEDYDDDSHRSAVGLSNARAKQVRKALGFTYPDQPMNF